MPPSLYRWSGPCESPARLLAWAGSTLGGKGALLAASFSWHRWLPPAQPWGSVCMTVSQSVVQCVLTAVFMTPCQSVLCCQIRGAAATARALQGTRSREGSRLALPLTLPVGSHSPVLAVSTLGEEWWAEAVKTEGDGNGEMIPGGGGGGGGWTQAGCPGCQLPGGGK